MKAGFGSQEITPVGSMRMAGFDRRIAPSSGCLDPLFVSVLALQDTEERPFFFCCYDLLGVDSALCAALRRAVHEKLGLSEERVWVSATHTHAGPSCIFTGRKGYDAGYVDSLVKQGLAAAQQALKDSEKAAPSFGFAQILNIASRRNQGRNSSAFPMPLALLRFTRAKGELVLVRFACHPTVLDEKNTLFSRDLPGAAWGASGGKKGYLFLNGACADLSTRFTRKASNREELTRLGGLLFEGIQKVNCPPSPQLGERIAVAEKRLRLTQNAALLGAEKAALLAALRVKAQQCADLQEKREYDSRIAVLERESFSAGGIRDILLSAVDLGPILLFSFPFEIDSEDGAFFEETLSEVAGKPVYLLCYTGGYDGYLPSGNPLSANSSYEDIASPYGAEAREQILECAITCVLRATT